MEKIELEKNYLNIKNILMRKNSIKISLSKELEIKFWTWNNPDAQYIENS